MKVVVNKCFGGFGLSEKAYEKLIEYGIPVIKYEEEQRDKNGLVIRNPLYDEKVIFDNNLNESSKTYSLLGRYWDTWANSYENRSNPILVKVVEELGGEANSKYADLEIVEIPDNIEWVIDEYDGIETIHEKHRSW